MTKRHRPTDESKHIAEVGAGLGFTEEQICLLLKIDGKTLRRHYRDQLDNGHTRALKAVGERLYDLATKGEPRIALGACIFWMKARGHWKENDAAINVNASASANTGPVLHVPMPMTDEQWNKAAAEHQRAVVGFTKHAAINNGPVDTSSHPLDNKPLHEEPRQTGMEPDLEADCIALGGGQIVRNPRKRRSGWRTEPSPFWN